MNFNTAYRPFSYLLMPVIAISLAFGMTAWSQEAQAHKGHAGPTINFIKKKAALKAMLPSDTKIVKRKQPLKDNAVEWAKNTHDTELDGGLYSYYLASDRESKAILGAAYVGKVTYRHGDLKFAVGIDADNRITQAAILSINEKYVVDFDGNVGTGLIADYAGLTLEALIAKSNELASSDKATREFAIAVREAVVLLATFTR